MYVPDHFAERRVRVMYALIAAHPLAELVRQGPQAYVTPSWYPSKRETGQVVPTCNYAVVHAAGALRIVRDAAWLRALVERLTHGHEARQPEPWEVSDAPEPYVERMVRGIVGFEIPIARLQGNCKMSQNRLEHDRRGVLGGLAESQSSADRDVAETMRSAGRRGD